MGDSPFIDYPGPKLVGLLLADGTVGAGHRACFVFGGSFSLCSPGNHCAKGSAVVLPAGACAPAVGCQPAQLRSLWKKRLKRPFHRTAIKTDFNTSPNVVLVLCNTRQIISQ